MPWTNCAAKCSQYLLTHSKADTRRLLNFACFGEDSLVPVQAAALQLMADAIYASAEGRARSENRMRPSSQLLAAYAASLKLTVPALFQSFLARALIDGMPHCCAKSSGRDLSHISQAIPQMCTTAA